MGHELAEIIDDPQAVIVIEWGDIVSDALPAQRLTVMIERQPGGENLRCITVSSPPELRYVYADALPAKQPRLKLGKRRADS